LPLMVHLQKGEKDFYLGYQFVTSFGSLLRTKPGENIHKIFPSVLEKVDQILFDDFLCDFILLNAVLIQLQATVSFLTWLLNISMRRNLVSALHRLYFSRDAYFRLNSVDNAGIDNPDQRITQDAERMCSKLAKDIFPYILIAPGVIAFYTYKTWMTAGPFGVAIIYTYFVLGVIANRILVSPLTKWTARVERSEGDFRVVGCMTASLQGGLGRLAATAIATESGAPTPPGRRISAENIIASSPKQDISFLNQCKELGLQTTHDNTEVVHKSDVVFLAVKPPHVNKLLPSKSRVVRVMPNTPAVVRAGASAFAMGSACRDGDAELVR
uniref:ABC transmembrane type-1 domain-containing protein n=1 Tax=Heligmosomoides polygyrus TaxID=6339 RepID=A0A8L8KCV4_HELPZ